MAEDVKDLPKLFHGVSQSSYDRAVKELERLRAEHSHKGRPIYRDDQYLLFALCEMFDKEVETSGVSAE